ncbi:MAG: 3-hydroxyacyl-CoA dehydrogenase [Lysobacterales bacterium]|nr:MAG: 3-hydroxyacyl-CoA dehydrogenase [Xanthomonadales bacterium]
MLNGAKKDLLSGVVGAGTMGRGIAQVAVAGGLWVKLFDKEQRVADEAVDFVAKMLRRAAEKGRTTNDFAESAIGRLSATTDMNSLSDCDLVMEAIFEDLGVKQQLFRQLENIVTPQCVLATNTSSLSITEIASVCRNPNRVAGFHFFNPVPLMKLVEVVDGVRTSPEVTEALETVGRRMGREPVRVKDSPGFLVNHAGRGYGPEALRILSECIASPADIDAIMTDAAGFRLGPFALLDLVGIDVAHPVMEQIYRQYFHEPAYQPSVIGRQRVAAGLLGRKSGVGFYDYGNASQPAVERKSPPGNAPERVWISRAEPDGHAALVSLLRQLDVEIDAGAQPGKHAVCLVTPVGEDASTTAVAQGLDPARTLAVDTLFGLGGRRPVMQTAVTDPAQRDAVAAVLGKDGVSVTIINDSPGFVAQRIVALIVNVGCNIAQQRIAAPSDIDTAVRLGLNYPSGPLEWGDAIGPARILQILESLQAFYLDGRYRPSPWLRRRAALGVSLLTPDPETVSAS